MPEQFIAIERLIAFEEMDRASILITQDDYTRSFRIKASVVGHPADLLIALHKISVHIEEMKRQVAGGRP